MLLILFLLPSQAALAGCQLPHWGEPRLLCYCVIFYAQGFSVA